MNDQTREVAKEAHAVAPPTENLGRMRSENLVSVVLVSSGDTGRDSAELRKLSEWCTERFLYFELIIVTNHPPSGWRSAMKSLGAEVPKLRIMTIPVRDGFDAIVLSTLDHAIGDYVVALFPGELETAELDRVLDRVAEGQTDLVRALRGPDTRGALERFAAGLAQVGLRFVTGQSFVRFPARAVVLSRAAISRIILAGGYMRFFRILDMSAYLDETTVTVKGGDRRLWSEFIAKLRVVGEVFSVSAIRLVRLLSVFCFLLAVFSFAASLASLLIWTFRSDIAPGWTSLSMLLSILFGSNFAVLGAICLGLVRLIHQSTPDIERQRLDEISGGDLFDAGSDLNVRQSGS